MSDELDSKHQQLEYSDKPRFSAIVLIYVREMRDQLRDRRTLFTIALLPIMLYPLVGTLLLQIAQFTRQHTTSVCIVGAENIDGVPPLLDGEGFAEKYADGSSNLRLVIRGTDDLEKDDTLAAASIRWIRDGTYDAVVVFPTNFSTEASESNGEIPSVKVLYNLASDESQVALTRISKILSDWRVDWVSDSLKASGIDLAIMEPFELNDVDLAPESTREAAFWSKILPFIMLIWAMTGAFYPAIDLVAGEKERGTLETLLCSPALRSEIVWGKLGAVASFSMLTALLNAGSMLVTSSFVFQQIGVGGVTVGPPPLVPMLWLFVALVPLSCLFSALALAVAAMARSSKEGQYYLMPLMMVTLPLVLLPMLPGMNLSTGTSLIPVTGMFLLVRSLVEGQYTQALLHLPMVIGVTMGCLWLAVTWAKRQFENEAVLFGGQEQWELGLWVKHLWRDRQPVATTSQAYACGAIILVALFFGRLAATSVPGDLAGLAKMVISPQLGLILAPALLMSVMLTTSVRTSLRVRWPNWHSLPMAVVLGVTLHPLYLALAKWIEYTYPVSDEALKAMIPFVEQMATLPWISVIFLMAFVPAVCEELAFRGFIFGGLIRQGGRLRAVIVTALMFGISHGFLQQSIAATCMGMLLGLIALRTGSVLPCMLLHFTNNALSVSMGRLADSGLPGIQMLITKTQAGPAYQPLWFLLSIGLAITCLLYFASLRSPVDESNMADLEPTSGSQEPASQTVAV
ncbi:ABC transporter permease subunit [bacterium]|nr:ABC transporter permease subunit [bacterium]